MSRPPWLERHREAPGALGPEGARALRVQRAWALAARALAYGAIFAGVAIAVGPFFADLTTFGFHDWDVQTSHRELVRKSLLEFGEFPAWNPYACGGFPAWGYVEGATVLVSPYLPAYLALPMPVALRLEVLGQALLGALGAYALAGSFSSSYAARAFCAAVWATNGRFGLQTAAGHTWHLAYAFLPWCFHFFELARRAETPLARRRALALAGLAFAMMVYAGGIYPLPHAVVALGIYALVLSVGERSLAPLGLLGAAGGIGIGLSAPKLFPLLDGFAKAPRLVASTERLDLGALLTLLTSRRQGFFDRPAPVFPYGWHEWGMYVSWPGLLVLALGFVAVAGRRETALKTAGLSLALLGLGAFHPKAPWTLLHENLPVFRSQHVPSRFLYPAVLLLALVAAAGIGRAVARRRLSAPWLDALLALGVLALACDVARVAARPMAQAMWMVAPEIPRGGPFRIDRAPPYHYVRRDWAGPMYLAMLGNRGVLDCYGTPPFARKGALAEGDPRYRGEAFVVGAEADAELVAWSPSGATVEVRGQTDSGRLVYNTNFDEGWQARVGGGPFRPAEPFENTVSVRLEGAEAEARSLRVELRYRPPGLGLGLGVAAVTLLGLGAWLAKARRLAAEPGGSR